MAAKHLIAKDLHTIVALQDEITKILDRLAKHDEPRLAVIKALGEVDTGLRHHALSLGNDFYDEADEIEALDLEDFSDTSVGNFAWTTLVTHVNDANNHLNGYIRFSRWSYASSAFVYNSALVVTGGWDRHRWNSSQWCGRTGHGRAETVNAGCEHLKLPC